MFSIIMPGSNYRTKLTHSTELEQAIFLIAFRHRLIGSLPLMKQMKQHVTAKRADPVTRFSSVIHGVSKTKILNVTDVTAFFRDVEKYFFLRNPVTSVT